MKVSVTIRKWNKSGNKKYSNPSMKNIEKQVLTLHKKMKKKDQVVTEYSIEKDSNMIGKYHTHMMIHYNDENNLKDNLTRFIGSTEWENKGEFIQSTGSYGNIFLEPVRNEIKYRNYMNKKNPVRTLV